MLHNIYSNHYHSVPHVHLPYNADIPHGLVVGKQIFVSGAVLPHANRFEFNLYTHSGIAIHINPRFDQGCVVRNSQLGSWGPEERDGPFPFQRGQVFELVITVEHDKYCVTINGQHAFHYRHRTPFHDVVRFNVEGDISVNQIVFSGGVGPRAHEILRPPVPYALPLAGGAAPGRLIQINGQVPGHARRFEINLQNGTSPDAHDIALHFNPRFDQNCVVRTNRCHGSYGPEERGAGQFPFFKGSHFELLILIEHNEFKVAVNGQHFVAFPHRNPLHEITHLFVGGDVIIDAIRQY